MRESNFSFPVQNRAAVVISSQLYDRRALDTTSPLPLFNSLTHLTYLTSTSPRIRDILTVDGGLERLVRLLREFCASPPPPQSPRTIYGLKPPLKRKNKNKNKGKAPAPSIDWLSDRAFLSSPDHPSSSSSTPHALNPLTSFDRSAAFRFSLAFQCVVNIGVRGSETVRARVVTAGMLDVVSSVLECWLVSKGFAVCPSPTGSGAPRESREVRVARRMELLERRQREIGAVQPSELARALRALPQNLHPNARAHLERGSTGEVLHIPVHNTMAPIRVGRAAEQQQQLIQQSQTTAAEDTMFMDVTPPITQEPQSSGSVSAGEDDVMETEEDDAQGLRRRDTIRGPSDPNVPLAASAQRTTTPASGEPSFNPSASASSSTLPVPVPTRRPIPFSSHSNSSGNISDSISADTSANATPVGGNTPTGSVTIEAQARERSGTVVGRPVWDAQQNTASPSRRARRASAANRPRHRANDAGTGTDDDGGTEGDDGENDPRGPRGTVEGHPARMAVIVQADASDGGGMDMNMIVDQGPLQGVGMGVEQGLVNLDMQANDDMAMGAPPGAPGAVQNMALPTMTTPQQQQQQVPNGAAGATPRQLNDLTPRAVMAPLVHATPTATNARALTGGAERGVTQNQTGPAAATPAQAITTVQLALNGMSSISANGSPSVNGGVDDQSAGPYREEDVLLSLQLLAYLSKYPHVRQAFYKNRIPLGPPLVPPQPPRAHAAMANLRAGLSAAAANILASTTRSSATSTIDSSHSTAPPQPIEHAPNVFSLVERFTFRPSPSETHLPRLPQEIQYWAGVIMRNACRKDETRGGIRQCANMVCGKWESYPREFAKCRRCRKAKYCGKECQSKAWADGHRFWCSSRDAEGADAAGAQADADAATAQSNTDVTDATANPTGTLLANARHRVAAPGQPPRRDPANPTTEIFVRDRDRQRLAQTQGVAPNILTAQAAAAAARGTRTGTTTQQPPTSPNLVVRLTNAPRQTQRGADAAQASRAVHALIRNTDGPIPAGSAAPRPRIVQHAAPPPSTASPGAGATNLMDVDPRRSSVRRRADTLPVLASRSTSPSTQPPSEVELAGVLSRQSALREMISHISTERERSGLPPLRGLDALAQEVQGLTVDVDMDVAERNAHIWRLMRDFDRVLEDERLEDMRASAHPQDRRGGVDEDGDARMA